MNKTQLRRFNTKLKTVLATSITLLCLSITTTAHADFRKALDAYQNRDGATMLKEVKDAVDKKNDDGLILFISVLELDNTLVNSRMFVFPGEYEASEQIGNAIKQGKSLQSPWQTIFSENQVDEFNLLLDRATKQSSLESQYRLISLRQFQGYTIYSGQAQDNLVTELKKLGEQGYPNVYPYLMAVAKTEAEKNIAYKKGVALGQTKLLLLSAVDYLLGNKNRQIPRDEKKGLQLLAQGLSKPDSEFYYADIANQLSSYYLKKDTTSAQKQAYLWSLVALTTSRSGLVPSSLIELKKKGVIKKNSPNIDALWDESFNKVTQRMNELGMDINQFYDMNGLPHELKSIKYFDLPYLIAKNQKIDLQKQPVFSFHHFYYDKFYIIESAPVRNYLIDIYADGRVNFSQGSRLDRTQNTETLAKITPEEVQNLIAQVKNFGVEEEPLIVNSKNAASCGMADCYDFYSRIDAQASYYYMTLRESKKNRTLLYHGREGDDLTSFFAKTFKLLEDKFHTQQYRCSALKTRNYYQYCIEQDQRFFEAAKQRKTK